MATLLATTLAPDIILPFAANPAQSAGIARAEEQLFNAIAWPPQVLARAVGIWIDSHTAQVWPSGWPAFAAFALRLSAIAIPFWFIAGLLLYEAARATLRLRNR